MKKQLMVLSGILFCLSCKAQNPPLQQMIPVEDHIDILNNNIENEISDNTYFKDINHVLDKYAGIWIGTYDNKTYEIQVEEYIHHSNIRPTLTFDKLRMRYKITDAVGNVIENTLNLPDDSEYVIKGQYLSENEANYILSYMSQEQCGSNGDIYINVLTNGTHMNLFLWPDSEYVPLDCPNGWSEAIFPVQGEGYLALTKQ